MAPSTLGVSRVTENSHGVFPLCAHLRLLKKLAILPIELEIQSLRVAEALDFDIGERAKVLKALWNWSLWMNYGFVPRQTLLCIRHASQEHMIKKSNFFFKPRQRIQHFADDKTLKFSPNYRGPLIIDWAGGEGYYTKEEAPESAQGQISSRRRNNLNLPPVTFSGLRRRRKKVRVQFLMKRRSHRSGEKGKNRKLETIAVTVTQ